MNYISAEEAVSIINSNERVFIHGAAATPQRLVDALTARHTELRNVEITHLHTEGSALYADSIYSDSFYVNTFFVGKNIRQNINEMNVQYIPMFLSEIPNFMKSKKFPIDTSIVQVSPPDVHGFCSLGVSVDIAKTACDVSKKIIAMVNPNMPRTLGDGFIHCSKLTAAVYSEDPIFESSIDPVSITEDSVGRNVAELVDDGACLQMGIGAIPNAVLQYLTDRKNLGIHSEMFSDGILPLIEAGIINGSLKTKYPNKIVSSFAIGSRKLYDFMNDNPQLVMLNISYVNDASVICKNSKVTAINSAIEIDLTGQICSDSIGSEIYSGVGGQMDFMRGAAMSEYGKPIIAMASTTSKGESKIVPILKPGAGVVTTRAHVQYIVTEFGTVDLYGKNILQRAKALISIAHPDHREKLDREAYELFYKKH